MALAALAVAFGGCSFVFVHGPPHDHERLPFFDCTTSNVLPILDALYAGAAATDAALAGSGNHVFASSSTSSSTADTLVLAGEAALVGASAIYGFSKTSDCRKAQELMLKRAAQQPGGMPVFAPAPRVPGPPAVDPWTGKPVAPPPP